MMNGPWIRLYTNTVNNLKAQQLPGDLFKIWVNLLCIAGENNGILPEISACAFLIRETENAVSLAFQELEKRNLLQRKNGKVRPHNWEQRQYQSDTSTPRVQKFRAKKRNADETPSDADTDPDTDPDNKNLSVSNETSLRFKKVSVAKNSVSSDEKNLAVDAWNQLAEQHGLARITSLNPAREKHLKARLKEVGGIDGWRAALAKIPESSFLLGDSDSGWRADFDFTIKAGHFAKLREGAYVRAPPIDRGEMVREAVRNAAREADRRDAEEAAKRQPEILGLENGNANGSSADRDRQNGRALDIEEKPEPGGETVRQGVRSLF